ncbi:MAG TPA: amidase family protein [Dongiaceae bacterium]|jgi:aspartyl-tRNA(Asn)/glutamyl-tRNA(Gln) amidotransferase subunit A|nr:amidase family protein [Dongiaceae bacterium]
MASPLDWPLSEISARLAEGRLRVRALIEEAQSRHDPALNAYKTWAPDFAVRQADAADAAFAAGSRLGALTGIPVSVKDIYGVEGLPVFAGSPRELPARWRKEGPLVRTLRAQIAVIMGKAHTVEFAFGGLGVNAHWPTPWNPRDRKVHRSPGGSSSGAGVTLGEGTALIALGTDTAGSVRIPASMTGNAGLKTTKGRWSTGGVVPLSPTFDTTGLLARSAADLAFAFHQLAGAPIPVLRDLSGVRLGRAERFFWEDTSPGVSERVEEALGLAEADGARIANQVLPAAGDVFELYHKGGIVAPELYAFLNAELPDWLDTLDPRVRRRMEAGKTLPAWEYLQRKDRYVALGADAAGTLAGLDALVCPTVPITPPPVADIADDDVYIKTNLLALRNTCPASFLGLCALTLPAGRDAVGMPVGLQLVGSPGSEERLLAIAVRLEQLLAKRGIWHYAEA